MKYPALILLAFIAFSTACKKSKLESINTTQTTDSLSYQPSKVDSRWSYDVRLNNVKVSSYDIVRMNQDSIINSKTYEMYKNESNNSFIFNRRDGNRYYNVLTAATNKTELCVLDVSKNVNDTWIGGVNGSDTYEYTIVEKTPSMTQNGIQLKNVINVKQERKDNSGNITLTGNTLYAEGVGTINTKGSISGVPTEIILTNAIIK